MGSFLTERGNSIHGFREAKNQWFRVKKTGGTPGAPILWLGLFPGPATLAFMHSNLRLADGLCREMLDVASETDKKPINSRSFNLSPQSEG